MKIKVNRGDFLKELQKVTNSIEGGVIPILSNVVLEAKDNKLFLTTTDTVRRTIVTTDAAIIEEGAITLPAKKLATLVSKYNKDEITFDSDGNSVKISCGRSRQTWNSMPIDEFPKRIEFDTLATYKLDIKSLIDGIQKTIFAVSKDSVQSVLNSLCFTISNNILSIVSADGRRLSLVTINLEGENEDCNIVVPFKTASELKRLLAGNSGEVVVKVGEKQIEVSVDNMTFISLLEEEKYVDYEKILPKENNISIELDSKELLSIIERVVIALDSVEQPVYLSLKDNCGTLSASSKTIGQNDETFDVEYQGEELNMSFNPYFIIDLLKSIKSDKISFNCNGSATPVTIKDYDNLRYVFMPMRDRT